jgi:cholest-4-en-3-one 26-monooxygenase
MDASDINLLDKDVFTRGAPHEWFTWLRHNAPVYRHPEPKGPGFWVLSKHEDIVNASRDPALFSSDVENGGILGLTAADRAPIVLMSKGAKSVPLMDPPEHRPHRQALERNFRPGRVAAMEDQIRAIVARNIDEMVRRDQVDFVEQVGGQITLGVLANLLGAPEQDWPRLLQLANITVGADDPEYAESLDNGPLGARGLAREMRRAAGELGFAGLRFLPLFWEASSEQRRAYLSLYRGRGELQRYSLALAQARRREPQEDLVTQLVQTRIDGEPISDQHVVLWIELLLTAGHETSRTALSHGIEQLMQAPDQYDDLVREPELIPTAVEEMLRWATPVQYFRRAALADTEIRGQQIRKDETVALWFLSGNRDEEVFEDPFRFDIRRSPNNHLAFGGGGPHHCLGNKLARLTLRVVLEELTQRVPRIESAGPAIRLRSNNIHGIKHLPVRLRTSVPTT